MILTTAELKHKYRAHLAFGLALLGVHQCRAALSFCIVLYQVHLNGIHSVGELSINLVDKDAVLTEDLLFSNDP